MIQFYETQMGQKFFMRDVPALIKAINRLADAMENMEKKEEKGDDNK